MIEFPKCFSEFCGEFCRVFRRFAMASANDAFSDGSDIDAELDDSGEFLDQNQTVADPIDRQQLAPDIPPDGDDWMNRMLDSDSDDDEFLGFQNSWKFDNFHPRRAAMRFNGASGPSVLHPPEASPLLYFLSLLDRGNVETHC